MKLVAQIKLLPTPDQRLALFNTMERANDVCNAISDYSYEHGLYGQYKMHSALY